MRKGSPSSALGSSMAATVTEGRRRRGGPTPCCIKVGLKKGPWTPEEDEVLASFVRREGEGKWRTLPKRAGLRRCGKSCRLRWMNYLRPSIKHGPIAPDEEDIILRLHRLLGNRWSLIAGRIPGRTDNEIKNYWNTHLSKKLISQGIDPRTHKPLAASSSVPAGIQQPDPPVLPCPNPNPNPNCNTCRKGITVEGLQNDDDCGGWKNSDNSIDETTGNQEDGELGIDCYPDEIFSFLDSLINEDVFQQQEQDIRNSQIDNDNNNNSSNNSLGDHDQEIEMQAVEDASTTPSADPMLGLIGTGWESYLGHHVDLEEFPSDHIAGK